MSIEAVGCNGRNFTRCDRDGAMFDTIIAIAQDSMAQLRPVAEEVEFSDVTWLYGTPKVAVAQLSTTAVVECCSSNAATITSGI
jgi:hypothetical protein